MYIIALAGTDGLEPSLRESKSRALPLRYVPINGFKVSQPRILARFNVVGGEHLLTPDRRAFQVSNTNGELLLIPRSSFTNRIYRSPRSGLQGNLICSASCLDTFAISKCLTVCITS